jgi:hypothetical protein
MRNAAGQPNQISGLGLHPDAIEFQVQHAVLNQDEFVLGGMDMNRNELAGVAVGLEREGRVRHRLGEIDLAKNIPSLAGISRPVPGDAFLERRHDVHPLAANATLPAGLDLSSIADHAAECVALMLQKLEV